MNTLERLTGGSKKGVYRLGLGDGSGCLLYVWAAQENYWPASGDEGPFADASGAQLFLGAHARLTALGVRVPLFHHVDLSHSLHQADVALVEDVGAVSLERLMLRRDPAAGAALAELRDSLALIRAEKSSRVGKVGLDESPGTWPACPQIVLDRALAQLRVTAPRVAALAGVETRLESRLRALTEAVAPRSEHALVHGELGPDHVLIDSAGSPVLIDIEGTMYFDVEWEHAFLELRFGDHYPALRLPDLDEDRLALYRLALHLSLVAGPLRILDGDFPQRELMQGILD